MTDRPFWESLVPSGSIAEKAVKSGIWAGLLNGVDRVFQLAKLVVLANLLSPSDFGLMGIALLVLATFKQFTNLGLDAALIHNTNEDIDEYLNTVWFVKISRSLIIFIFGFIAAPYAASFFGAPEATILIRAISLSPLILSLQNPGIVYFRKELEFHKEFLYKISGTIFSVSVAIAIALHSATVWALVLGFLMGDVVKLLVSYQIHSFRPKFNFNLDVAKELYGYGKWLTASGIIMFLITQGDDAFVGWFLGASALGLYQMAYRFSNAPATEISHVISSVSFPVYSKLQKDLPRLRRSYFKTVEAVLLVACPLSIGIIVVTPTFVSLFFGEEWFGMILLMQTLSIWGLMRAIGATNGALYNAVGRPDIDTKISMISVVLIAISIYPAANQRGLSGIAFILAVDSLLIQFIDIYAALSIVNGSYRRFLNVMGWPMISSLGMGLFVWFLIKWAIFGGNVVGFLFFIVTGAVVYSLTILAADRYTRYEIPELLRKIP